MKLTCFVPAEGLFMSTTRQSGLPTFPGYLWSPALQEWRTGWLRCTSSSWTLCWNLAHIWEAVGRSYVHHADLLHVVPTLLAKEEEWTEEIWLKLIFIQFTGLQQETQKWKEGNPNLSICSPCSRCLRAREETLQQSTHLFVLFFPLYFHFWWKLLCQAKLNRTASLFVHFSLALNLALVDKSWR